MFKDGNFLIYYLDSLDVSDPQEMLLFYKQAHLDLKWRGHLKTEYKRKWAGIGSFQLCGTAAKEPFSYICWKKEAFVFVNKYYKCVKDWLMRLRWLLKKADGETENLLEGSLVWFV